MFKFFQVLLGLPIIILYFIFVFLWAEDFSDFKRRMHEWYVDA